MKLTVVERVLLSQVLPAKGSFTNLKLLRVIREDLSFSEKENKVLNFRQDGPRMMWDSPKTPVVKDIKIGEVAAELIKTELLKLDKEEKLAEDHISIYEKFVTNIKKEGKVK